MDPCRHCGRPPEPGARFCAGCGRELGSGSGSSERVPEPTVDPPLSNGDVGELRLFDEEAFCPDCGGPRDSSGSCPICFPPISSAGSPRRVWPAVLGVALAGILSFSAAYTFSRRGAATGSQDPAEARRPPASARVATEATAPPAAEDLLGEPSPPAAPSPDAAPDTGPAAARSEGSPPETSAPETATSPVDPEPGEAPPPTPTESPPPPSPPPPDAPGGSGGLPPLPRTSGSGGASPDADTRPTAEPSPTPASGSSFPQLPRAATAGGTSDLSTEDVGGSARPGAPRLPLSTSPNPSPASGATDPGGSVEARISALLEQAREAEGRTRRRELCEATDRILALDPRREEALAWRESCADRLAALRDERREVLTELLDELVDHLEEEEAEDALDFWTSETRPATAGFLARLFSRWEDLETSYEILRLDPDDDGADFRIRLRVVGEDESSGEEGVPADGVWQGRLELGRFSTPLALAP